MSVDTCGWAAWSCIHVRQKGRTGDDAYTYLLNTKRAMEKVDNNKVVAYLEGSPLGFSKSIKTDPKDKDLNEEWWSGVATRQAQVLQSWSYDLGGDQNSIRVFNGVENSNFEFRLFSTYVYGDHEGIEARKSPNLIMMMKCTCILLLPQKILILSLVSKKTITLQLCASYMFAKFNFLNYRMFRKLSKTMNWSRSTYKK